MRKLLLSLAFLAALSAHAQGEFSAQAGAYKNKYQQMVAKTRAAGESEPQAGPFVVTCKTAASPIAVAESLKALGAEVKSVFGRCVIVTVPASQIDAMAQTEGVLLIDVGQKSESKTDITRMMAHADEVQDGTGAKLPQAYTGKGVIIGLMDQGFDFTHPMFKDKNGNLRIKAAYMGGNLKLPSEKVTVEAMDKTTGQTMPIELGPGIVTNPKVILDTTQVKSELNDSHGTHCAGIAAGSRMEGVNGLSGNPLGGLAPEADLILCEDQMDPTVETMLEAMPNGDIVYNSYYLSFVVDYAKKQNKPLVVSWSQNNHRGWHNGTSPMAQLVGDFCKEGNVMMLCSSNEGDDKIYIHRTIKAGDSLNVAVSPIRKLDGIYYFKTVKPLKVRIGIMDLKTKEEVYSIPYILNTGVQAADSIPLVIDPTGEDENMQAELKKIDKKWLPMLETLSKYIYTSSGCIGVGQGTALESAGSDKTFKYTSVDMLASMKMAFDPKDENKTALYALTMHVIPQEDTEVYSWIDEMEYLKTGIYERGTDEVSVGEYNTSGECVSVGAWCANNLRKTVDGKEKIDEWAKLNDVAFFSSYGTDLAGHRHPQACTPGTVVYSAVNSFVKDKSAQLDVYTKKDFTGQFEGQKSARTYEWGIASGTSMATPASAGIVALWMQAAMDKDPNRRLTCKDIKDIIEHSCDTDDFTKAKPERFGAGKMNAYKGLLYVLGLDTAIDGLSKNQPEDVSFRMDGDRLYADGAAEGTPASLYNLQGVLVSQTAVKDGSISLEGLRPGVYAVQLGRLGSTLVRK